MLGRNNDTDTLRTGMLETSELRIEEAAGSADRPARMAASRVLESAQAYREWGISHNQLISAVVMQKSAAQQVLAVKRMALSVIHRKAPFEYLRDHAVRGGARQRFFQTMYGRSDYARVAVLEHRHYTSAMCSYLCIERFCGNASLQRIRDYERRYTSFWNLQVQARERQVLGDDLSGEMDAAVLRSLRTEVEATRKELLDSRASAADRYTLEELRRPTGDTVRIRRPQFLPDYQR